MNDLISQVTPLTTGIVWFVKDETQVTNPHYKEIDYLLDGLLTANLKIAAISSSRVIVGKSFNRPLYVFIVKEAKASEIESFISLFRRELTAENDILVVDEVDKMKDLKKEFKEIANNLKTLNN